MVSTTPQTKRIKVMDVNSNLAQEALRKRQEDEERQAQQAEFLNRSLRGSRKLQALESHPSPPPPQGVINDGYSSEDTEDATSAPGGVKEDLHSIISEYRCVPRTLRVPAVHSIARVTPYTIRTPMQKEHCKNKGYKTSDVSKSNRKAENMAEN
uniref:Uncharacterized protein n=1 Tax=Timema tahoe TaxID=61484 RepID=A0A7R9IFQ7_9NEOP|nr:unnamed protein product [Timema tahoe]